MGAWILFILFKEGVGENHDFMFIMFIKILKNHDFVFMSFGGMLFACKDGRSVAYCYFVPICAQKASSNTGHLGI